MADRMPVDSVRGRVRRWIESHAGEMGGNVLEIGSRMHNPAAWWLYNRDLATGAWLGIDIQDGHNVDRVQDIHDMPAEWKGQFSSVLCSEVMEHVARPWVALPKVREVIRPGGMIVITTLTTFHIHGYPDDYYRYTESGLRLLLEDAGFVNIGIEYGGDTVLELKNHDETVFLKRVPLQIFAVAYVP